MPECPKCGSSLARTHRKFWEKPIYSIMFRCRGCDYRVGGKQDYFRQLTLHTLCPRCGNRDVEKRKTRDRIDKVIYSPLSMLNAFLGGRLYHCVFCRIQYYDVRGREPRPVVKSTVTKSTATPIG
jgi:hypothetical protein